MKLKVGMYVRMDNGIFKIYAITPKEKNYYKLILEQNNCLSLGDSEFVIKASCHIIDLIEAGDYVNGNKVGYIDDCVGAIREFNYDYEDATKDCGHWEDEIETVLIKEQYENNCYEIEK